MQKHASKNTSRNDETEPEEVNVQDIIDADLAKRNDEILAEIDKVLEPNAQEFVESYKQQGGQ